MKVLSKRFGLAAVGNAQNGTRRFQKHYLSLRSAQEQVTTAHGRRLRNPLGAGNKPVDCADGHVAGDRSRDRNDPHAYLEAATAQQHGAEPAGDFRRPILPVARVFSAHLSLGLCDGAALGLARAAIIPVGVGPLGTFLAVFLWRNCTASGALSEHRETKQVAGPLTPSSEAAGTAAGSLGQMNPCLSARFCAPWK